ncbi:putative outer membrane protein [Cesiribacter andamanensis AMV16]|uniref:Putative outer membrane protein n=2 Tax=Cesiribacter TaxID=1133570 RepID=M7NZ82_9BACT|nr:putative outer membrane protein [Cesiribacter andamanensis AMV16]
MIRLTIPYFVLALLLFSACTPRNLSYTEALDRNNRKLETDMDRKDATFLVEVANFNLLLQDLNTKALQEGYARVVVDYATQAQADHNRMADELRNLAKNKKVVLPASMSERFQLLSNEVLVGDRRNFDKSYLNTAESVYKQAIRMFEEAALNAGDSRVRAFAASKLEVLRANERKADSLETQLM